MFIPSGSCYGKNCDSNICVVELHVLLVFTLLLPLTDLIILFTNHCLCFFFTRLQLNLPGNRLWQESVRLRRCTTGIVNRFYCSLTLTFSLCAEETLFQQMGETDITINLFCEKGRFLMLYTPHVLLSSMRISVRGV